MQNERVWIDCQGENPADRENLGPVIYHPTNGISKNYFPYRNQEGYLSPAIFVEFTQVKCKWENVFVVGYCVTRIPLPCVQITNAIKYPTQNFISPIKYQREK